MTHGAIEYDDQDEWLTETDADGASRIVARDVPQWFGRLVVGAIAATSAPEPHPTYAEAATPPELDERLAVATRAFLNNVGLLDPENAPSCHGKWFPDEHSMGDWSVTLRDDDGCNLFVDPFDLAEIVNGAVTLARLLNDTAPPDKDDAALARYWERSAQRWQDAFVRVVSEREQIRPKEPTE